MTVFESKEFDSNGILNGTRVLFPEMLKYTSANNRILWLTECFPNSLFDVNDERRTRMSIIIKTLSKTTQWWRRNNNNKKYEKKCEQRDDDEHQQLHSLSGSYIGEHNEPSRRVIIIMIMCLFSFISSWSPYCIGASAVFFFSVDYFHLCVLESKRFVSCLNVDGSYRVFDLGGITMICCLKT